MSTQTEIKAQRKTELPEGWENYSACKDPIPDTPFIQVLLEMKMES